MVLILGFLLLILAASLYLAGLWLPAGVCCVVGGACMGWLLDEVSDEDGVGS